MMSSKAKNGCLALLALVLTFVAGALAEAGHWVLSLTLIVSTLFLPWGMSSAEELRGDA